MITEELLTELKSHKLEDLKELYEVIGKIIKEKEVKPNGSGKSNRIYKRE